MEEVTIDDFLKVDLRVGKVVAAVKVAGSDKLIKLDIDLNEGDLRQIVSGIGQFYQPEELISKQLVIVTNLKPRKFLGVESQGMILCADDGQPAILSPTRQVALGAKVR